MYVPPIVGGSAFGCSITLDFGSGDDLLTTTVTGQTWVTSTSIITATIVDDARATEALIEQIHIGITNRVIGTGFDVVAHAPNGLFYGQLEIHVMGL